MHPERRKLDKQLKQKGEDIVLRRRIGTGNNYVEVRGRAVVRGFKPEQLAGTITQQDSHIIMSPTPFLDMGEAWPGEAGGTQWPRNLDQVLAQGRVRSVQAATAIMVDNQPVRIEMTVRG